MRISFLKRPRYAVIFVLGIFVTFHAVIFISKNYSESVNSEQKAIYSENLNDVDPNRVTVIRKKNDAASKQLQLSRKVASKGDVAYSPVEIPDTVMNGKGFQRPPESKVKEIFGSDIQLNAENEFVQAQPWIKVENPDDGKFELLPNDLSNGIKKYTDFGYLEDFEDSCDDNHCNINGRIIKKEMIKENPGDMFKLLPPEDQFLKQFKNPCWNANDLRGEEKLFCIPYFYIIGFTKCGTTDMFAVLRNHTLVSSRAGKETHYFDRQRRGRIPKMNRAPSNLPVSFMSYANAGKFRQNLITTYKVEAETDILFHGITMDATPSHVWDNEFWEIFHPGYREPPTTNADVIAALYSKTKIIVSLRGPIARMQSAYQFFCAFNVYACDRPVTPQKFHGLVVEAVDKFNSCLKSNTIRGCVYSTETHQLATHLYASVYSVYIADWLAAFPRDQVHVIMFEEHIADEVNSINSICDFLEIPRFTGSALKGYLEEHQIRNSLKDSKKIPYVLPETNELLLSFFKPYLTELVNLLGDDKWFWNYY